MDPWTIDDEWAVNPSGTHDIRPWCVDEYCVYCNASATHKIEETTGPIGIHPYTAYVCCKHFFGHCS